MTKRNKMSLSETHPHLVGEWDFDKNSVRPEDVTRGSNKKIWWVCKKCGENWSAPINNRARRKGPSGCPECAGLLKVGLYESKKIFEGAGFSLISDLYVNSKHKMKYVCERCGFRGTKSVNEITNGYGCPRCFMERIDLLKENGHKVVYIWESDYSSGGDL